MAIVKNSVISRQDGDFSPGTASSDDEDETYSSLESAGGGISEDGASDADSGMGSDELDLSELGEPGTEICQVGNQSFSCPLELYDLESLGLVLSVETWNECLTEEERFALVEYLPDMDKENFALTLKELFSGCNFHFGSPLADFFDRLKAGLCDPRLVLYRRGLNIFQRHQHYHHLCRYQNSLFGCLVQIRDAWQNCASYGIEERLRLLNIWRSQRSSVYDRKGDLGSDTDSESGGSAEAYKRRRFSMNLGALRPSKKASFNALNHGSRPGKEKAKGILKVAAPKVPLKKEYVRDPGFDWSSVHGTGADDYYIKGAVYGMARRDDWDTAHDIKSVKSRSLKSKRKDLSKKHARETRSGFVEESTDTDVRVSGYLDSSRLDQVTVASYYCNSLDRIKSLKQTEKDLRFPNKECLQQKVPNGAHVDWLDANRPYQQGDVHEEAFALDSGAFGDSNRRGKKSKSDNGFGMVPSVQVNGSYLRDCRPKTSQGKLRKSSHHGISTEYSRRSSKDDSQSEETQSDSSEPVETGGNLCSNDSKQVYSREAMEVCQPAFVKLRRGLKRSSKLANPIEKIYPPTDSCLNGQTPEVESCLQKVKKKVKEGESNYLDDGKTTRKASLTHSSEKLQAALVGTTVAEIKRKGTTDMHHSLQLANETVKHGRSILNEAGNLDVNASFTVMERESNRSGTKTHILNDLALENDYDEISNKAISGYSSLSKKKKYKGDDRCFDELGEPVHQQSSPMRLIEGTSTTKKKGKRKADAMLVASSIVTPETTLPEKAVSDLEIDTTVKEGIKLQHKKPFTLITPTIHTGFSFSIIHLLSAVRKALITLCLEDTEGIGNHLGKDDVSILAMRGEQKKFLHSSNGMLMLHSNDQVEGSISGNELSNLPSLTVQEIVDRVRLNPGDPCILETQEPLQDLVRGVLKIFSSRTAPLGAKGWKALVLYQKSNKTWSWIGSLSSSSSDNDNSAEETSAEAWGIPHKVLVKLVDAFANWLKSGQETLQQIGSLPAPPAMLPALDDKERFRDLRAQKSLNTISPSSGEVRAYFHKEELLRYSIPDRAFQYTAVDGRKSIVAPLRRGGGKPTSKARDHFMLKPDRPPHVTILCLVRDAAARLPGSIGTRADVCTLIRDSQYIVEDVTDAQVNQVVSGALDRLHYERDPCVQFDGDRKLWVYLHRDREEEDFEDDGTSSTKKWKRQRKDPTDNSEIVAMIDSNYVPAGEPADVGCPRYDYNPDLNTDSLAVNIEHKGELVYNDLRPTRENVQSYVNPTQRERSQSSAITWGLICGNPLQENKMLCQENSTSQDFDDEAFSRERPVGLSSTSLF